jgi:hypothetical protein
MRRGTAIILALTTALVLSLPAAATTDKIPFIGEDTLVALLDPGTEWFSDGVWHVRGWTGLYESTSDSPYYEGETVIVANWNLNLANGNGGIWGTSYIELDGFDGGFAGSWAGSWSSFVWSARGAAGGFGDLDGWQQRYDLQQTGFGLDAAVGVTFGPGNR